MLKVYVQCLPRTIYCGETVFFSLHIANLIIVRTKLASRVRARSVRSTSLPTAGSSRPRNWVSLIGGLTSLFVRLSSVGWSVCHNFFKGREVTLPCSYRSNCLKLWAIYSLDGSFHLPILKKERLADAAKFKSAKTRVRYTQPLCLRQPRQIFSFIYFVHKCRLL